MTRALWVGLALIVYAMVAYPLLGMAFGHGYPQAPMFGLVPCPTTIFTFGMLLLAARPKRLLLWLPLVWSAIGFFAAVKFGICEDVGLLVAGDRDRRRHASGPFDRRGGVGRRGGAHDDRLTRAGRRASRLGPPSQREVLLSRARDRGLGA